MSKTTSSDKFHGRFIEEIHVYFGFLSSHDLISHDLLILFQLFNFFLGELTLAGPDTSLEAGLIVNGLFGWDNAQEALKLHVSALHFLVLEKLTHELFVLERIIRFLGLWSETTF